MRVSGTPLLFRPDLLNPAPEWPSVTRAKVKLRHHQRFIQRTQHREIVAVLWFARVKIEAHHVAILRAGGHGFGRTDRKTTA